MNIKRYFKKNVVGKYLDYCGEVHEVIQLDGDTVYLQSVNDDSHVEINMYRLLDKLLRGEVEMYEE